MTGSRGKIIVRPDPDVADLVPQFLEERRKEAKKLGKALEIKDFKTLEVLAHRTAGLAGGYGFDGLSDIARSLERAAINKDQEAIARAVEEYASYLASVVVAD